MRYIVMTAGIALVLAASAVDGRAGGDNGAGACGFYRYRARIVSVYDGDTLRADIDLGFHIWVRNEKLRLLGIDAPELKGRKNRRVTAAEKARAVISRDRLRALVSGRDVVVCTIRDKRGKYGRYLARIFLGTLDVNNWMLVNGYAVPYGQKAVFGAPEGGYAVAEQQ